MKTQVPVVEGLFTWPSDDPRLIGSRCPVCGSYQFPKSKVCNNPDCDHSQPTEEVLLSKEGTLYSFTIHYYDLREPLQYHKAPYAIGAVEIPEGLIIIGRLTETDPAKLKIGMKMRFKVDKLYEDGDKVYLTYFFEPVP
ncbi:MAG: Zn-ribbon domain-containing OB-fold protein [Candidatus Bathyarchaeia archaeon]